MPDYLGRIALAGIAPVTTAIAAGHPAGRASAGRAAGWSKREPGPSGCSRRR
jgi:hypothetical protein